MQKIHKLQVLFAISIFKIQLERTGQKLWHANSYQQSKIIMRRNKSGYYSLCPENTLSMIPVDNATNSKFDCLQKIIGVRHLPHLNTR